jgi:hypothetical protein
VIAPALLGAFTNQVLGNMLSTDPTGEKHVSLATWVDPDDAAELTEEFFERTDQFDGQKLVRRGRPKAAVT